MAKHKAAPPKKKAPVPKNGKPSVAKKPAVGKSKTNAKLKQKRIAFPKPLSPKEAAERGAAAAVAALRKKDWQAALTSLATAIEFDPFRAAWTALLSRALDIGGKRVEAFVREIGNEPFLGFWGLKAYAAHHRGDYKTAFDELENVTRSFPATRFTEAWGLDWLTEKAIRKVGRNRAASVLIAMIDHRYPEPMHVSDWGREQLNRAIAAFERIEAATGKDDRGVAFKGQMLSKAGRLDDAVAMAVREAERNPTFRKATAAAMAHKRNSDFESAIRWFRRAAELDPNNETCLLDIGDVRADQGKWQEALEAYEEAMTRVPNHDWAFPSAVYCRYRLARDPKWLEELRFMANAGPDECGMADMLKELTGGYNFEDRRVRAEMLMKCIEPTFAPVPRPHRHGEDEGALEN